MKKRIRMAGMVAALALATSAADAATICGVARDANGQPAAGVKVLVKDGSGKILGTAVTDKSGAYTINNVKGGSGPVNLFLKPKSTGYRPGSGVLTLASLDASSNVDWRLSDTAAAVAAQTGACIDPPAGLSAGEVASIAVLGVGAAAAGAGLGWGLSQSSNHGKPASPSR